MGHLLFARCSRDHPSVQALEAALVRVRDDPAEPRVTSLSFIDLDQGPRIGRVRAVLGLGWQARDHVRRVARQAGSDVDAIVEACLCGAHHLLGLGRAGPPTVRWSVVERDATWLDRLARQEGAEWLSHPLQQDEDAVRLVERFFEMFEAAKRPPPAPTPGKAS